MPSSRHPTPVSLAASRLQAANIPIYRTSDWFEVNGQEYAPGSWLIVPTDETESILETVAVETGLVVQGIDEPVTVAGHRLRDSTRVGLWRAANNMPGGWMLWLFEQYELNHTTISSTDFNGALSEKYDVIVLPSGTSRRSIVEGLNPERHDETWRWAFGVGQEGWLKLRRFRLKMAAQLSRSARLSKQRAHCLTYRLNRFFQLVARD